MTHLKHIALTLVAILATLVADAATESLYFEMPTAEPSPVEEAQFDESHSMPTTNVARLTLVEYRTPGSNRTAWAIYEYVDFSNRLYGEVKIVEGK